MENDKASFMVDFFKRRYSKQTLWSLFLMCAFPLHLWAFLMAFRDVSWVIKRTDVWDAFGVVSYGALFALVESLIVFLVMTALGVLMPKQWDFKKRAGFLSLFILIVSMWAIIVQALVVWNLWLPAALIKLLIASHHPVRYLYLLLLVVITASVFFPLYSFIRSKKSVAIMQDLIERFSTLTMLYLFFDLIGIFIIIIRNVS
jgi:hypothetical protein